jgi:hypothetical protein
VDRRLDTPRIVISGGDLAIVDGRRNWHGDDSARTCSDKTMLPTASLKQTTKQAFRARKKRKTDLDRTLSRKGRLR